MFCVNVPKLRGKIAEKGYNLTSFAKEIDVTRETVRAYLYHPERIPYHKIDAMASVLCDSHEEATVIFFDQNLRDM